MVDISSIYSEKVLDTINALSNPIMNYMAEVSDSSLGHKGHHKNENKR